MYLVLLNDLTYWTPWVRLLIGELAASLRSVNMLKVGQAFISFLCWINFYIISQLAHADLNGKRAYMQHRLSLAPKV